MPVLTTERGEACRTPRAAGCTGRVVRLLAWVGQTLIIAEQNSQLETPGGEWTVQEFAHAHDMSAIYDNASRPRANDCEETARYPKACRKT
jgi:hypothetical protein